MRTTALLTTAATLVSLASARIQGFYVPSVIAPDSDIDIQIEGVGYIQTVEQVAISFGTIARKDGGSAEILGRTFLGSKFLGPDLSNTVGNITYTVHVPSDFKVGDKLTITAASFALYGVEYGPTIETFKANITTGATTSADYVQSEYAY